MTLLILPGTVHEQADMELDLEVLAGLWRMEERHFYHAARIRWILRAFAEAGVVPGARVLDVGCGSGSVAAALHGRGYRVTGVDTAEVLVRKAHERCPHATFIAGTVVGLPPEHGNFDVVTLFDVLEHLSDPLALLVAAIERARPGARVFATVPALRSLHTIVDDLSGHKKRYERGELAALLRGVGLVNVEERGILRVIWPLLKLLRRPSAAGGDRRQILLHDIRVPRTPMNCVLAILCAAEVRLGYRRARDRRAPTLLATGVRW
jgi:SAM-dependent methyltransferase